MTNDVALRRRQQPFNFPYHAIHFLLIRQRDHEKLVALVKADDAVSEQPYAVEEGVATEQPTYRCAGDPDRVNDLREHCGARGTTESAEQRRADVFRNLALKFHSFAFGFS